MPQPLRVLILEDRKPDARLMLHALQESGFDPDWEWVDTEQNFATSLDSSWDVILADYSLPQFDALRALALLRERKLDVPLIVVSGTIGEETAVAAMKEGAADYLLKDRLGRLGQAVSHALEQRRLWQSEREAERILRERTKMLLVSAEVGSALNRSDSLQETLRACTDSIVNNLGGSFARIWTYNKTDKVLELQASSGKYTHLDGPHSRVPLGQLKIGTIAQRRTPHLTNDVLHDPLISDHQWARDEGMVAFAGYPLIVEDRLVGVMAMFACHALTTATLDTMAAVANQIATGIERKRGEEKLRVTEFTLRHVATGVFWNDSDANFFDVNEAACRLTGYTRDELLLLSVFDLNPTVDRESWKETWQTVRQRGALALESQLRRKDGSDFPASVNVNYLQVDGQEWNCSFVHDITEQKEAEESQQQIAARFRAVYNQLQLQIARMPLAYVLFDTHFRIIDWNPAAEEIFGYAKEGALGMGPPFGKIMPASNWPQAKELLARIRSGDMTAHSTNENLTKDGRTITCEWINTPLETDDGQFAGLLCLAQDVTERTRLEEQFRHAQKMEAVGSLAGGVAHDFNNLLSIITGYSEVMLDELREGDPLRELAEEISRAGFRAATLTRQLLAFSRKQVLVPVVMDLSLLLEEMHKMLRRLIGEDIELSVLSADDLWHVRADVGQMEQVIMNLVVNARDAMPQGGKLTLQTTNLQLGEEFAASHPEVQPGEYVLLSAADNGSGMERLTAERIFEPFYTTKDPEKGTGLGLSTVYGIVKQSGGHIDVESHLGQGTTFRIYLPREQDATAVNSTKKPPKKSLSGSETILVVEDEDVVRSLACFVLKRHGYNVLEARHGGEALLLCERHEEPIHLLATDVVMPHMSGSELAERLLPLRPEMKVLYLSGYTDDAIVRHGLVNENLPFLQKPYTAQTLAEKVREVLDSHEV